MIRLDMEFASSPSILNARPVKHTVLTVLKVSLVRFSTYLMLGISMANQSTCFPIGRVRAVSFKVYRHCFILMLPEDKNCIEKRRNRYPFSQNTMACTSPSNSALTIPNATFFNFTRLFTGHFHIKLLHD
ncbi:hypothetical protein Peur_054388 [Populus x canadensis]